MKKKLSLLLCVILVAVITFTSFNVVTTASSTVIAYNFTGANKADKGFAEGTITLTAGSSDGGTYWLYWADDSAALPGYDYIGKVSVANSGSASAAMPKYTAIPARATKILAFKGTSAPTNLKASAASAAYTIPASKALAKTDSDLLYSFASYSDIHMESNSVTPYDGWSAKYPYDEQHLTKALSTAAARNVDFIVTTGDHVNNQRNDKNGGNNNTYAEEWSSYLKILAASDFVNPVYEAIGNHELWNYETDTNKTPRDWTVGSRYFAGVTGLDSTAAAINSGKAYYEVTEPVTGDHFLFMSLEGGFYTDANNEFSDAQLTWLENKLKAYKNDGKNTFILEHANFNKWGAGDQLDNPIYDIPLKDSNTATTKLKNILQTYKDAVIITGHTHFKFSLQLNYSDNNGTSATMIHNSSVGGVRDIQNHTTRINDKSLDQVEGYIVEVYDDATIFYGANLYYNSIIPTATYIVKQSTSAIDKPEPTQAPTSAPTEKPTEEPTEKPTEKPTERPTDPPLPTNPPRPTEAPTDPPLPTNPPRPTEAPTQAPTEPEDILWGDADGDGELSIFDATAIQRHLAAIKTLSDEAVARSMVTGESELSIFDATAIQRKLAGIIKSFPVEGPVSTGSIEILDVVPVGAEVELEEAAADLNTLRTQAKSALDKYWLLASYDQYQALKKAYKQNAAYDALNAAYAAFNTAVQKFWPGDNIDVYFRNDPGWSSVYAYAYNGDNDKLANWPGKACTKVSGNIWKVTVPTGKYNYIIFNNGSGQTIDLALGALKSLAYYTGSQYNGKYKAYPYEYK